MTDDEMIEAVAKAIGQRIEGAAEDMDSDWYGRPLWQAYVEEARAAIRVIATAVEQEMVAKIVAWLRDNSTPHNDIDEWADEIEAKWGKQ